MLLKPLAQLDYVDSDEHHPWYVVVWTGDGKQVERFESCVDAEAWIDQNGYELDCK